MLKRIVSNTSHDLSKDLKTVNSSKVGEESESAVKTNLLKTTSASNDPLKRTYLDWCDQVVAVEENNLKLSSKSALGRLHTAPPSSGNRHKKEKNLTRPRTSHGSTGMTGGSIASTSRGNTAVTGSLEDAKVRPKTSKKQSRRRQRGSFMHSHLRAPPRLTHGKLPNPKRQDQAKLER